MKSLPRLLVLALLVVPQACSEPAPAASPEVAVPVAEPTPEPLARLRAAIDSLMARPEHASPQVRVQHCLIGVEGLLPGVTRTPAEAEALTAELYARIQAGADFDALVREYTNDEHPGIYAMCLGESPAPEVYPRELMTLAFGDVAWRLSPGEVGVARYDGERFDIEARSPFGYHLIKRLE